MIPLNSDFSLLSLNDKNCFNETDNQITGLPVDRRNSLLATTECSNHLFGKVTNYINVTIFI
ncbi:unnamed protein product [Heterobilharzia americana]|nr:unnamed protein product [Heterobilharzia americana]